MGSLIAGQLSQGGLPVCLILRDEHRLATYRATSLRITHEKTQWVSHPDAVTLNHLNQPIHYLICCAKAYDVKKLLIQLKHRLHKQSIIILIHNGLGVLDEIKTIQPALRIICGLSTIGAYLDEPFSVHTALSGALYLGKGLGEFSTDDIQTVGKAFAQTQIPYQWEDNIHPMIWEKFAINCSINILTVLKSCKNGELLSQKKLLQKMTLEIVNILSTYQLPMSPEDLLLKVMHVLQCTSDNYSSMYKDIQHHRRTEMHYLNEHLVRLAQQKNIATPLQVKLLHEFYEQHPWQPSE